MKAFLAVAAMVLVLASPGAAQTEKPVCLEPTEAELKADVPELHAFHEIIAPMWHDAYPAQDTTMLQLLWPDIVKHSAAVHAVELPGILRDKKEAWQKGLERLHAAEMRYGASLAAHDKDALLKAAEDLHSAFEGLVRVIRPILPELAEFHEVLYKIYHYDLPNKDLSSLRSRIPALTAEMDTLNLATLSKRREAKLAEFEKARAHLSETVSALAAKAPSGEWTPVEKAVEEMHTAYKGVEAVFN